MIISVDTHEQLPYRFDSITNTVEFECVSTSLPTGDYMTARPVAVGAASNFANQAVVERKTLSDLYASISGTTRRRRFEAEMFRMQAYGFAAVVIEATWLEIVTPNTVLKHPTRMRPRAAMASLLAWATRHRVHMIPAGNRALAEILTFRVLERWYRDGLKSPCDSTAPF